MKLLHKADPNIHPKAWNPPDLDSDVPVRSQSTRKEQVQTIFQKEDENNANSKKKIEKSKLHRDGSNKNFASWQPGHLADQSESAREDEWDFVEISDTPFDKSWKVKAPNFFSEDADQREFFISENEGTKILEKARHQAEEIILAAQTQADDVLMQAESEIDEQKKEGYRQGQNEARLEIEDAINTVKKMIEEVECWKTDLLSQSEEILVGMIKDISVKMFGEGVELDSRALQSNLNRVMENAHGLGALKIFMNPRDAKLLDSYWSEQQMLMLGEQVKIVPANNIKPGGCLIKGSMGTVDGRIETQLDAILKTFDGQDAPAE
jgi:flagellar assembly protein FliH